MEIINDYQYSLNEIANKGFFKKKLPNGKTKTYSYYGIYKIVITDLNEDNLLKTQVRKRKSSNIYFIKGSNLRNFLNNNFINYVN